MAWQGPDYWIYRKLAYGRIEVNMDGEGWVYLILKVEVKGCILISA